MGVIRKLIVNAEELRLAGEPLEGSIGEQILEHEAATRWGEELAEKGDVVTMRLRNDANTAGGGGDNNTFAVDDNPRDIDALLTAFYDKYQR